MYMHKSSLWTDITDDLVIIAGNWKLILIFKIITTSNLYVKSITCDIST